MQIRVTNISYHYVACVLIFFTVSFAEQKFFILMKFSLPVLSVKDHDHAFGVKSKKSSLNPTLSRFSPMLSFRSFIVLCFTLRPLIHWELISVKDIVSVLRFFFLFGCPVVSVPFVKKAILSPLNVLCQRLIDCICMDLFLGYLFRPIDLLVCSFTSITLS